MNQLKKIFNDIEDNIENFHDQGNIIRKDMYSSLYNVSIFVSVFSYVILFHSEISCEKILVLQTPLKFCCVSLMKPSQGFFP
jgi:hypothetical protein